MEWFVTPSGVRLRYVLRGTGPALLLLHGFTGTHNSFQSLLESLSTNFTCIAVDMIGHGESDAPTDVEKYRMETVVEDLYALMISLDFQRFSCLGYSMGGRTALALAVAHKMALSCLILESASPGIADDVERSLRRESDERLAQEILTGGIARFVAKWERIPLFSTQSEEVVLRERPIRLAQRSVGLAGSLVGMGTGAAIPLWTELCDLPMPILLITGGLDKKFTEMNATMQQKMQNSRHIVLEKVGHNTHAENPIAYNQIVKEFLLAFA